LILTDGFYEWQKLKERKQPYHIRRRDSKPFAFAGLWDRWRKGDEPVESGTILDLGDVEQRKELVQYPARPAPIARRAAKQHNNQTQGGFHDA
jgi:putative SOS response-associated peptidase YedK